MHVMTFIRLQLTGCQMSGFTVKLIIVITHPFMPAIGVIVLLPLRRYPMCAEKQAICVQLCKQLCSCCRFSYMP